jgi:hypothetical protein
MTAPCPLFAVPPRSVKRGACLCEQQLGISSGAEACICETSAHRLCTQLTQRGSGYGDGGYGFTRSCDYRVACGLIDT